MTCSAATMTPDMAYSPAAVSFRNFNKSWQIPAVTNQSVRKVQFLMTEELLIEIEFEINEEQPDWLIGWMQKASQLLNFPPNWDTYRSQPINPDAIVGAINFLLTNAQQMAIPGPDLIPHRSGGVQLEWHVRDYDLEVLVFPDRTYRVSYSRQGEDAIDDVVTSDPQIAGVALQELARAN